MKTVKYKKGFKFDSDQLEYTFQLKKRNWKWLWLLAILPLFLLFIRCERSIEISTIDKDSEIEIPDVSVEISYTAHYLYKDGKFFASEEVKRDTITNSEGMGKFEKLGCSVFSYIFYCFQKVEYIAKHDCYMLDPSPDTSLFHFTRHKTLNLVPKTVTVSLETLDKETDEPVADAVVVYSYIKSRKEYVDSVRSDGAGRVEIPDVPQCGDLNIKRASCYGYEDLNNVKRSVASILAANDSAKLLLTPVKTSFSYYVKNKYTKQPIPEASVDVILTSRNGQTVRGKSTTNVDGKGRGAYSDAFILAKVGLKASKTGYKDGILDGDYTVDQFSKLPDSLRVVYLEPEPSLREFRNVDSISKKPIAGVRNHIERKSIDGNIYQYDEISNRNGIFTFTCIDGDKIKIDSSHPSYESKNTEINMFERTFDILMSQKLTDLVFRTVDGSDYTLLPDCDLSISTSESGVKIPVNSGCGVFEVNGLYAGENISIIASKNGYSTNSVTISNVSVSSLAYAPQSKRDIPLNIDLPPCNGGSSGENGVEAGHISAPQSYNMGQSSGTFVLTWDNGNALADKIDVYNHAPNEPYDKYPEIFTTGMVFGIGSTNVRFSRGSVITVVVTTGPYDNSDWNYQVHCPQ